MNKNSLVKATVYIAVKRNFAKRFKLRFDMK
jgi:hypothetical protein